MHDAKGRELEIGDIVIVPCRVESVSPGAEFCNVSIRTLGGRLPDGQTNYYGDINTKQLIRANQGDTTEFTVIEDGGKKFLR